MKLTNPYLITDQEVQEEIKREEKQSRELACGKGCSNCDEAIDTMLPFYGIKNKTGRRKAVKSGQIHQYAKVM